MVSEEMYGITTLHFSAFDFHLSSVTFHTVYLSVYKYSYVEMNTTSNKHTLMVIER